LLLASYTLLQVICNNYLNDCEVPAMTEAANLTELDAAEASRAAAGWVEVYNACFTAPPWSEPARTPAEYAMAKQAHFTQRGLRAVEARDGANGHLLGVTYGWPAPDTVPDLPFYRGLRAGLGEPVWDALWAARPFEVVELMVDPSARGRGLGRALLERLCGAEPVSYLATHPDAPAAPMYWHLGWHRFGRFNVESLQAPEPISLDAYLLDRRAGDRIAVAISHGG
jgi:GNAT superfamily N-acetyltransferase